ncbi:hypothetical protein AVEN_269458-1 [Araneus ventricosus]|uniref:Uncharacterized protein n=1 Tax=Araneus ventricosus TaxID=182803 RepID=A0A4Y2NSS3_ARAVE|nr:hypothetical protein AVEN_269458-1 [Araneus ventricosus]
MEFIKNLKLTLINKQVVFNKSDKFVSLIKVVFVLRNLLSLRHWYVRLGHDPRYRRCIVTFDQLLFIKAMDIVSQTDKIDELSEVIVRLGGFHFLISCMGAVGKIMGGSGLEEMCYEVFAKNAVVCLANGQIYARALRTHSLSHAANTHLTLEYCEEDQF